MIYRCDGSRRGNPYHTVTVDAGYNTFQPVCQSAASILRIERLCKTEQPQRLVLHEVRDGVYAICGAAEFFPVIHRMESTELVRVIVAGNCRTVRLAMSFMNSGRKTPGGPQEREAVSVDGTRRGQCGTSRAFAMLALLD